jgi:hypothetical protein
MTTDIEQELYDDIDLIRKLSEHGIAELDTGDLDGLEDTIHEINEIAESWEDR